MFNRSSSSETLTYSWKNLNLEPGKHKLRDLWEHRDLGEKDALKVTLPSHGAALYAVEAARGPGS